MSLRRVIANNLSLKVAAVIVALVLWMFAKGEQTADRLLSIPLILREMPEGLTTVERPPETIDVVFEGDMKELLKLRIWGDAHALIDMSEAATDRVFRVGLSPANVVVSRDANVQIVEVRNPKSLDLEVDRLYEKRLPVEPIVGGSLAEGYYLLAGAVSIPDSVTVYGPRRVVRNMRSVRTDSLDVSGRRSRVEAARGVAFDERWNLHSVPREVRVFVEVEGTVVTQLSEVPVGFRHEPGFSSVSVDPPTMSVELAGPEHIASRLTINDVAVLIDTRGLPRGVHQLVPEIDVPEGITVENASPTRLTVTLE